MIDKIFSPEIAVKVFYAYIAASVAGAGVDAIRPQSPDLVAYRLELMEKKIERIESLIIKQNDKSVS